MKPKKVSSVYRKEGCGSVIVNLADPDPPIMRYNLKYQGGRFVNNASDNEK